MKTSVKQRICFSVTQWTSFLQGINDMYCKSVVGMRFHCYTVMAVFAF
jgi:hypothetical protein